MMNALEVDLRFTIELETDFPSKQIPTLDFSLWLGEVKDDRGTQHKLFYSFFMKPMNTRYSELENSARAWSGKSVSLAEEVYRRLLHTSEDLPLASRLQVINQFTHRLKAHI